MAIAYVNYTDGFTRSATSNAAAANHTTGNTILVFVCRQSAGAAAITDTAGNTYTQAGSDFARGGNSNKLAIFRAYNITGNASNVVTSNAAGADFHNIQVFQFSGMGTSDGYGTGSTGSGTSTAPSTGSLTPTNSAVIFAGVEADAQGQSAGTGYSGNVNTDGSFGGLFFAEYKISSSAETPASVCTSGAWSMISGVFNGPGGGGGSTLSRYYYNQFIARAA